MVTHDFLQDAFYHEVDIAALVLFIITVSAVTINAYI